MTRFLGTFLMAAAAIVVWTFPLPVSADANEQQIAGLRAEQAQIIRVLDASRDARALKQDYLDEDRTYVVAIFDESFIGAVLTTRENALKAWTYDYLQAFGDQPFDQADFEAFLKDRRDESVRTRAAIEDSIAGQLDDEARLSKAWKALEDRIAELMQAGATGTADGTDAAVCVELVEIHPTAKPLSEAASLSPGAGVHTASDQGTRRDNPLGLTLSWTAPPLRLCIGTVFDIEMTASNAGPTFEDNGINYIAKIQASSSRVSVVSCSNPATWMDSKSETAAILVPTQPSYTNTCTFRVDDLAPSETPRAFLQISLATIGTRGAGEIQYRYATR